jgi:hypothetical protein
MPWRRPQLPMRAVRVRADALHTPPCCNRRRRRSTRWRSSPRGRVRRRPMQFVPPYRVHCGPTFTPCSPKSTTSPSPSMVHWTSWRRACRSTSSLSRSARPRRPSKRPSRYSMRTRPTARPAFLTRTMVRSQRCDQRRGAPQEDQRRRRSRCKRRWALQTAQSRRRSSCRRSERLRQPSPPPPSLRRSPRTSSTPPSPRVRGRTPTALGRTRSGPPSSTRATMCAAGFVHSRGAYNS